MTYTGIDKTWEKLAVYRETFNISPTLVGKNIFDHSDVVGAITWSFSTEHLASMDSAKTTARREIKI